MANATRVISLERARRIVAAVWRLDQLASTRELVELCVMG